MYLIYMKFKPLELLEKKYEIIESKSNNQGDFGKIYKLLNGDVVKILYDTCSDRLYKGKRAQLDIHKEAKEQKFANKMGMTFPVIKGIYAIKGKESGFYFPGLVMENLGDVALSDLEGDVLEEAKRQYKTQIALGREIGFNMNDCHEQNAMWKNGKTRMCDAGKLKVDNGFN